MLERKAGDLNLALTKLQQGAAINEELINAEPGNPQWVDYVAPSYRYIAEIDDQLNRPKDALTYYRLFYDAKRTLAFRGVGPVKARKEYAEAAKLLGDHSKGLAQMDAYRGAARIWSRLVDDPTATDVTITQYDLLLDLAKFFDDKKDWRRCADRLSRGAEDRDHEPRQGPLEPRLARQGGSRGESRGRSGAGRRLAPPDPPH